MTQRKKHHRHTVLLLLVVFCIFLVSAWEDRTFMDWKDKNLSLYRSYKDIEYLCHRDLNINERFLLDLSVMLNVNQPFDHNLFGHIRRYVYLRIVPDVKEIFHLIRNEESGILIARTDRMQRFKFIGKQTFSNIGQLDRNDLSKIRGFMKEHNIKYYVIDFTPSSWTPKKNLLAEYSFSLVYNNQHFMLFKLSK